MFMFEDGEAAEVEQTDSDAAEPAESAEPAEDAAADDAAEESVDAADDAAEAAPADGVEVPPEIFNWNGEVDEMKASEWFAGLDLSVRSSLLQGMEKKYRNFERGFTKAFQETASRRKTLDRREQDIRDQEMRVQQWLHGDIDPLEEKQKEIDSMKQSHVAAIGALRDEHTNAVEKAQIGRANEIEELITARDEALQRIAANEAEIAAVNDATIEARTLKVESWLKEEAADVYNDEESLFYFCALMSIGASEQTALDMVRGGKPPEERAVAEDVPAAIEMMDSGGTAGGTESQDTRGFEDMFESLRREAQAEEAAFRNA